VYFVWCPARIIYSYIPGLKLVRFPFEVDLDLSSLVVRMAAVTPLDFRGHQIEFFCRLGFKKNSLLVHKSLTDLCQTLQMKRQ